MCRGNRTWEGVRRGGERRERMKRGTGMKVPVDKSNGDSHYRAFVKIKPTDLLR